ncbi:MAG: InlB B-repeat-containing protein, partial [Clostridia bacterium]|nr:InlB B-repeat-containing protein [Clostridia bacterium]
MQSKTVSVYKKILSVFLSVLLAFGCVTLALNSFCPRAKAANYGFTSASYGWATGKNDNNNVYNWTPYPYANSGWTTLLVAEIGNELYALASIGTDNLGAYRIEMAGSSGGAAKFQTEDVDTGNSSIIKNTYYWEGVYTNSTNQYVFFRPSSDSANLHCIKNDSTSLTSSYTGYYISSSYNSYLMDSNYNYIYFTFSGKNIGYLSTSGTNKVRAFYGNGTVQQVSLSYNGNGGSGSVATQYRLPGDVVTLSPNGFSRAGYTFTGWNTLANGTGTAYAPGDTITLNGNTTLYAQWSRDSFTVNYVARTGGSITGQTSESVSYGAKPSGTAYAASAGYAFDKWTQDSGTSAVTPANVVITAATTFYANFKTIPYTITYNLKSDETNDPANPSTYNVENSAIVLGDPSKPNYNFDHWEDQNGTPVSVIPAGSTGNITLTPVFTEKQYTIVYKANGGQGNDVSQTAGCASTVTLKDSGTFTRTGYNLVSWNTVSGGTGASYAPGSVQNALSSTHGATVELFAQWQAKDYTITYNMDPNAVTLDGAPSGVKYDGDYEFTVNVDPAYTVTDVTVTGVESFTFDPDTGVVTITNVTGDV